MESQTAVPQGEGASGHDGQRVAIGVLVIGENVADNRVRGRVFLDRGDVASAVGGVFAGVSVVPRMVTVSAALLVPPWPSLIW